MLTGHAEAASTQVGSCPISRLYVVLDTLSSTLYCDPYAISLPYAVLCIVHCALCIIVWCMVFCVLYFVSVSCAPSAISLPCLVILTTPSRAYRDVPK